MLYLSLTEDNQVTLSHSLHQSLEHRTSGAFLAGIVHDFFDVFSFLRCPSE